MILCRTKAQEEESRLTIANGSWGHEPRQRWRNRNQSTAMKKVEISTPSPAYTTALVRSLFD